MILDQLTIIWTLMLILMSCSSLIIAVSQNNNKVIYVPRDYPTIRDAINHATENTIIVVSEGTYTETIRIKGKHGLVIKGSGKVVIKRETLLKKQLGIIISGSKNIVLENIIVEGSIKAVLIDSSHDITLRNLTIKSSLSGIYIEDSDWINITDSQIAGSPYVVRIDNARYIRIYNNTIIGRNYCPPQTRVSACTVETDTATGIALYNVSNAEVINNTILAGKKGIAISRSYNVVIENNTLTDNINTNIYVIDSQNVTIVKNILKEAISTLTIGYSYNVNIWLNYIGGYFDITGSQINWYTPEKIHYMYKGKLYYNHLCNYWFKYSGRDKNGDGIGDKPYNTGQGYDNYPLIEPPWKYTIVEQSRGKEHRQTIQIYPLHLLIAVVSSIIGFTIVIISLKRRRGK